MRSNKKLSYRKTNGNRDLGDPHIVEKVEENIADENLKNPSLPLVYSKTDGTLSYGLVCVISGGTNRESDFLKVLIKGLGLYSLRILFVSKDGQGLQPYQMQERWEEICSKHEIDLNGSSVILDVVDKVFLLTDVDEFYEQLTKILSDKSENDFGQWIISNPCFEIWLYYCELNNPEEDLVSLKDLTPTTRSHKMKHLGQELIPGGLNGIRAFEKMKVGIENSNSHFDLDENGIPTLFATQMHQMAQYLVDALNKNSAEYDRFVQAKENFRAKMSVNKKKN